MASGVTILALLKRFCSRGGGEFVKFQHSDHGRRSKKGCLNFGIPTGWELTRPAHAGQNQIRLGNMAVVWGVHLAISDSLKRKDSIT